MSFEVDRVVICDAFSEPDRHYAILSAGRCEERPGRRPSARFEIAGGGARKGLLGVVGKERELFDPETLGIQLRNEAINRIREEVKAWRLSGYRSPEPSRVTLRCLEWWFGYEDGGENARAEERKAVGKRFFFAQQEAIETILYLFEAQRRRKMPETRELLRYALKLATGCGKTVVMGLLITWSTLHKLRVTGSTLSANFLVLVPNLTVRSRVSGQSGDGTIIGGGLIQDGKTDLYTQFDMVPPEFLDGFKPNVQVRNWQGLGLDAQRKDWLPESTVGEGRFIPAAVLRAMQRRRGRDPNAGLLRELGNVRDLVIINDEAHHVYGERKTTAEEPAFVRWSKILERLAKATRVPLVVDLSATPWYGSGSTKTEGTLFEWVVTDFSVYDAFESGLVKVVRLPDPDERGALYLDLWDKVRDAKTEDEYLTACKGAIASIYSSWRASYETWSKEPLADRGPSPVLLCVADNGTRAGWLFHHLIKEYEYFRNDDDDDVKSWMTVKIDSKTFDADKGGEALIREMVDTVGKAGQRGERVRCIVSVNMLSEGWDVKSVSHILGLRAFGSPLLTEQIIGRGLRRVDYSALNLPLAERGEGADETVDAFGIPFVGFPVQKRKRPKTGGGGAGPAVTIEVDETKAQFAMRLPNVRAWAVGVHDSLVRVVDILSLPRLIIDPKQTPSEIHVKPVVGGRPEAVLTLDDFRREWPSLRTAFVLAEELFERMSPGAAAALGIGPTFDELLELSRAYLSEQVDIVAPSSPNDVGMYFWRKKALDILENAVRGVTSSKSRPVPVAGTPEFFDTGTISPFRWPGIAASGAKCHLSHAACHTDLEREFADYLDDANDVLRYVKNERLGFSITYWENGRPRQYYPDFVVIVAGPDGRDVTWIAETKGEIRTSTALKRQAVEQWCDKMSQSGSVRYRHLFVPQRAFEKAVKLGITSFSELAGALMQRAGVATVHRLDDARAKSRAFKTWLPVYSLRAAAGYFGEDQEVEQEGWADAEDLGKLSPDLFVAFAQGKSMEPTIRDGDLLAFRRVRGPVANGAIVLAHYLGPDDPETGGSYTVKKYAARTRKSLEGLVVQEITLSPLNPAFVPIVIAEALAEDFRIVAKLVTVLGR